MSTIGMFKVQVVEDEVALNAKNEKATLQQFSIYDLLKGEHAIWLYIYTYTVYIARVCCTYNHNQSSVFTL